LRRRTRFREERLIGIALALAAAAYAFALFGLPFHGTSSASAGYCTYDYECPPANLMLEPPSGINDVGTNHTITATVTDTLGNPVSGIVVRFSVTGSVTTSGMCTTNAAGQCTFTYAGPSLPGADLISAYADSNNNNVQDPGEPTAIATKAWVLPGSTVGHVTGGGQIMPGGNKVTFGFNAKSDGGLRGECNVVDLATRRHIKCTDATALVVVGNEAWIYGNARDEGTPTTYVIHVVDNDEPGRGHDTFSISTTSGYSASGTLTSGNIQVHS
jgi:Bacterial Ig-like domain (group 1)